MGLVRWEGGGRGVGDWEVHCAWWAGRACVLDGGGMSRGRGEGMQWEGCGVIVVVGRSRWGVVGFVARRDWLPSDDRDCHAVVLEGDERSAV